MDSRKTKYIIIACLCLIVVGLSIGYALLSTRLNITGTAKVPANEWDVIFLEDEIQTTKTGMAKCDKGTIEGTSISGMSVEFTKPGDSCTFSIPVKNNGNISAKLVDVTGKSSNLTFLGEGSTARSDENLLKSNVVYEVNYGATQINGNTVFSNIELLKAGAQKTITLKVTFKHSADDIPKNPVKLGGLDRGFIFESLSEEESEQQNGSSLDNIPNKPELNGEMIPVYYEKGTDKTGTWKKADINNVNNNWYDYSNQKWANAVTVVAIGNKTRDYYKNADVGTPIDMDDINTMWVWIPRYSYTIKSEDGGTNYFGKASFGNEKPTQALPGEIDVKFISKVTETGTAQYTGDTPTSWRTNEAFDFGGEKKSGIWVAKFEMTGNLSTDAQACTNTNCDVSNVTVKPSLPSLRNQTVSSFFFMSRSMQLNNANPYGFDADSGDLHMMKNDEWGAVAYLSQSKYGKYGNSDYNGPNKEIYQNKSSGYITGNSNGTPSQENTNNPQYAYNDMTNLGNGKGQAGPGASTTGNVTGIYDMAGGANEYVMGVLEYDEQEVFEHDGEIATGLSYFKGLSSSGSSTGSYKLPNEKYYNKYKSASPTLYSFPDVNLDLACNGEKCYGHALGETYGASSGNYGWYDDYAGFVYRSFPWFRRGGNCYYTSAGVFYADSSDGVSYSSYSCRLAFAP